MGIGNPSAFDALGLRGRAGFKQPERAPDGGHDYGYTGDSRQRMFDQVVEIPDQLVISIMPRMSMRESREDEGGGDQEGAEAG